MGRYELRGNVPYKMCSNPDCKRGMQPITNYFKGQAMCKTCYNERYRYRNSSAYRVTLQPRVTVEKEIQMNMAEAERTGRIGGAHSCPICGMTHHNHKDAERCCKPALLEYWTKQGCPELAYDGSERGRHVAFRLGDKI